MQNVAQAWLVYRLTHSELLLGTAWFCSQIPVFALGPLGGLAADRYSRHKLVIVTQTLSMLQALALAVLTLTGTVEVWHILALAVAGRDQRVRHAGPAGAHHPDDRQGGPAQRHLAQFGDLQRGARRRTGSRRPAGGGGGRGSCFLINAMSFLAVIGCLAAMRASRAVHPAHGDSPWSHLVDGFRYAWNHRGVRTLLA